MARDELNALRPVLDALNALGVEHYIGGSVASSLHGRARATLDVDVVADLRAEHVEPLVGDLEPAYYIDAEAVRRARKLARKRAQREGLLPVKGRGR